MGEDFSFTYGSQNYEFMDNIIEMMADISDEYIFKYSTAENYY